jgi:DNA-binding Lrp family transcriptional regulator
MDSAKVGYDLTAVILIQAEGRHLIDVENEIAKISNVISVYDITGDFDIAIISKSRDSADLNALLDNLLAMPHVKKTVTNLALNIIKEDFGAHNLKSTAYAIC